MPSAVSVMSSKEWVKRLANIESYFRAHKNHNHVDSKLQLLYYTEHSRSPKCIIRILKQLYLVDPLDSTDHSIAFFLVENWRTFVFRDLFVVVNSNDQTFTHRFGLSELIGMSKMDHLKDSIRHSLEWTYIETSVWPHSSHLVSVNNAISECPKWKH